MSTSVDKQLEANFAEKIIKLDKHLKHLGPVVRSLVSANRWLRAIKTYRFPWYLTLVRTNHASSNPGLVGEKTESLGKNHNY